MSTTGHVTLAGADLGTYPAADYGTVAGAASKGITIVDANNTGATLSAAGNRAATSFDFGSGTVAGTDAVDPTLKYTHVSTYVASHFADTVTLTANGQNATGNIGNDTFNATGGTHTLLGGAGADTFTVTHGTVTIGDLGHGTDVVNVSSGATVNATLAAAWTATSSTVNNGTVSVDAKGFNLDVSAAGGTSGWTITNTGAAATLTGSAKADTITGGAGNDVINGGDGNDIISGGGSSLVGSDTLNGGDGDDTLTISAGGATMTGGNGADTFIAGVNGGAIITDFGNGADVLKLSYPSSIEARLVAAWTATSATTNYGDASIFANGFDVNVAAAQGGGWLIMNEYIMPTGLSLTSSTGISMIGSSGSDAIFGGDGSDTIIGNGGDDMLVGGNGGNDTLIGGPGADIMTGGSGNDTFVLGSRADTRSGFNAADTTSDHIDRFTSFIGHGVFAGDTIVLGTGTNAFGTNLTFTAATIAHVTAITVAAADNFTQLFTGAQGVTAGAASTDADAQIYDITVSAGNVAGRFMIVNDDSANLQTTDTIVNIAYSTVANTMGTTDGINAQDISFITPTSTPTPTPTPTSTPGLTLSGGDGNDTLNGSAGDDTITGGAGNDTLNGGDGNDTISGGDDNDTLNGGAGDDTLIDGHGNDTMNGGDGNDTLISDTDSNSSGSVTMTGGAGVDTFKVEGVHANVTITDLGAGGFDILYVTGASVSATLVADWTASSATYLTWGDVTIDAAGFILDMSSAESSSTPTAYGGHLGWTLINSGGATAITGSWGDDTIRGGNSGDLLIGGYGQDHIYGGDGNDVLIGGEDSDQLNGGGGNDDLTGGAGNDGMTGGAGVNTFHVDAGSDDVTDLGFANSVDIVIVSDGAHLGGVLAGDWTPSSATTLNATGTAYIQTVGYNLDLTSVSGTNGWTIWAAGTHSTTITGSAMADIITGSRYGDTLNGGDGNDSLTGGESGSQSADVLNGGNGDDTLWGLDGNDTLNGAAGNDTMSGGDGNDTMLGGTGNDTMVGDAGNDTMNAGDGNDILAGGAGADSMTGGSADDSFAFGSRADTQSGYSAADTTSANIDRITDFVGTDGGGGDIIALGTGTDAFNPFGTLLLPLTFTAATNAHVTAISVTTADNFTDLFAAAEAATAGTASTNADAQLYDLTVSAGNLAGHYLIVNDDTAALQATDTIIDITGITGIVKVQDITFGNTLHGSQGPDSLNGGDGNDTILGDTGNDTIGGGDGNDTLVGGGDNDTISGGNGNDTVIGDAGNDTISGGNGNDIVTGGAGADSMTGGSGNDTFVLGSRADTQGGVSATDVTSAHIDKITDFVGTDGGGGDIIRLGTGTNAFGTNLTFTAATTAHVTAISLTLAFNFRDLFAYAQAATAGTASTNGDAQLYDVTVSSGNLAGHYLIVNDDSAALQTTDTIIDITGITGIVKAQDIAFG